MNVPVFDLHCDTALAMVGQNYFAEGTLRENSFHIDLQRARKYDSFAQCFACFTSPLEKLPGRLTIEDAFERQLGVLLREINGNEDVIRQAYSAEDVEEACASGLMSAIFSIEGPAGFGYDPELLGNLYDIGFRMTTLGWNERNPLTGSHKTGGALTDLGKEYVLEAQRVGMIVDVSHISDEGFWGVVDVARGPVIASHSNSRTIHDIGRNISDDMFRAICQLNGVVGINLGAAFVGGNADLDAVCDHVLHFLSLDPEGKHIALGGDLDGVDCLVSGFEGVQSYDVLADKLLQRGVSMDNLQDIYWNNAFGVIKSAVRNNKK